MRTLVTLEPASLVAAPDPGFLPLRIITRVCFRLVTWRVFDQVIGALVMLNILFMGLRHSGASTETLTAIVTANYIFTALFALEAVFKVRISPICV